MGVLSVEHLAVGAWLLVDSAPIILTLESHPALRRASSPWFSAHAAGRVRLAVTTITIAEVLAGPLKTGDEALARRYRSVLESWRVIALDADIAETAARLRVAYRLKLPDAVQAASALAIDAAALVTFDHDFSRVASMQVLS